MQYSKLRSGRVYKDSQDAHEEEKGQSILEFADLYKKRFEDYILRDRYSGLSRTQNEHEEDALLEETLKRVARKNDITLLKAPDWAYEDNTMIPWYQFKILQINHFIGNCGRTCKESKIRGGSRRRSRRRIKRRYRSRRRI